MLPRALLWAYAVVSVAEVAVQEVRSEWKGRYRGIEHNTPHLAIGVQRQIISQMTADKTGDTGH